jgi:outer membrane protein
MIGNAVTRSKPKLSRYACVLVFAVFGGISVFQVKAADLVDIYRLAVDADPMFRAAYYNHKASREILTQARSGYLPSVTASYDWTTSRQEILESDNVLFRTGATKFPTSVIALSLTQPIFRYGNYVRIGQAKTELKQADAELEKAAQELMLRTAESYLFALAAEDHLEYLKSERLAVKNQLVLARAMREAKLGRESDLLEADARLASVSADYSEAEVERGDSYEAIYELTGEYPTQLKKLQKDFPLETPEPLDVNYWVDVAAKQNWELIVQREAVDVSRQEVRRQDAGHLPTVDLELRETIRDTGGTVFGGGSEVENRELMLSFKLPLYSGGSVSSKKREAKYRYQAEREVLMRISRKVKRETEKGFKGTLNAIERVEVRGKEVATQEEVLKLKRAGYKANLFTSLSVLDAERDLYSAKRDLAAARYEYVLNSLRLKAIVGELSETDLIGLNRWLTEICPDAANCQ